MSARPTLSVVAMILTALAVSAQTLAGEPQKHTITGKLESVMAIGGETTGWSIQTAAGRVEVDIRHVAKEVGSLEGKLVQATGVYTTVKGPERGARRVFVIESIAPAAPAAAIDGTAGLNGITVTAGAAGVRGRITLRTGDLMPPFDPSHVKVTPLSVAVHVFKGKQHVATVQTDHDGQYILALTPGRYALVAEIPNHQNVARTFEVTDGQWTDVNVRVDEVTR